MRRSTPRAGPHTPASEVVEGDGGVHFLSNGVGAATLRVAPSDVSRSY